MSRLNVRRLTAGLLLAALLGLAVPASAAPAGWPLPATALGAGWVGQVLEWLESLLGEGGQGPVEKSGSSPGGTVGRPAAPEADLSSTADPNG